MKSEPWESFGCKWTLVDRGEEGVACLTAAEAGVMRGLKERGGLDEELARAVWRVKVAFPGSVILGAREVKP